MPELLALAEPRVWIAGLLAAVLLFFLPFAWLAARLRAAQRSVDVLSADLEELLAGGFAEQHRAMLIDLHAGLERQADRVNAHGAAQAERLQLRVESDLASTRGAMHALELGLQAQLAAQKEEAGLRFAELASRQAQLRSELLEGTLAKLSEHGRADRELLETGLRNATAQLGASMEGLTRSISERMDAITGKVGERLDEGFRKTNETFVSVMARLATIDEAQKKIDGLTTNVVSLQELLGDKKARGAFGEVQLEALIRGALPPDAYEFQAGLPNGSRVDCLLRLPEPTGLVAVDSKFPLENYQRMYAPELGDLDRRAAQSAFRGDLKKHIDAIAAKYIIANLTSDGAVMFVPAEAVFAEIHAYQPEIVAYALGKRVWIVSPTTLMAVLNTARAVLKDVETRKQIHIIKDALARLSKDFSRFDERMQKLASHIGQAHKDVQEVHTTSRKISAHFQKIESARVDEITAESASEPLADTRAATP